MERKDSLHDRRTVFTKSEIRKAYLELMDQMPKEKISVTEICKKANINRGTFYLHYADINALWNDIEDIVYQESIQILENGIMGNIDQNMAIENFRKMQQDNLWRKVFFSPDGSMRLYNRIQQLAEKKLLDQLPKGILSETELKIYVTFFMGGCYAIEKRRLEEPWEDFERENTYYNKLMDGIYFSQFKKKRFPPQK